MSDRTSLDRYKEAKASLTKLLAKIASLDGARYAIVAGTADGNVSVFEYANSLIKTIADDVFRVAVIGEYSTGKSTLLNVLLGLTFKDGKKAEGLLPAAIAPTTAVVTNLVFGEETSVSVRTKSGMQRQIDPADLSALLSQPDLRRRKFQWRSDPKEMERIAEDLDEVQIACNSSLLGEGIEIIDTPGLGSIYREHGDITRRCVASVDAALFLISVDPPMGEREMTFLQYVTHFTDRFVFVQTKRDQGLRKQNDEFEWLLRERQHRERIEEVLGRKDYPFFCVSALQAACAKREGNSSDLAESGMPALEAFLKEFLVELRGTPRLKAWHRRTERALNLLKMYLADQKTNLEARVQSIDTATTSTGEYLQWEQTREAFRDWSRDLIQRTDHKIHQKLGAVQQAVSVDAEHALSQLYMGILKMNMDHVSRLERSIVRSIQTNVVREIEHIVDESYGEMLRAISQTLGQDVPTSMKRFQSVVDPKRLVEDLEVHLDPEGLIRENTVVRERPTRGLLDSIIQFFKGLFGIRDTETITEYSINTRYFTSTLKKAVQDTVADIRERVRSHLKEVENAVCAEMDRIAESARQADEERKRFAKQSIAECNAQLQKVVVQLETVEVLENELEDLKEVALYAG